MYVLMPQTEKSTLFSYVVVGHTETIIMQFLVKLPKKFQKFNFYPIPPLPNDSSVRLITITLKYLWTLYRYSEVKNSKNNWHLLRE